VLATLSNAVKVAMTRDYANYEELAAGYFEMFRSVFLRDRHLDIPSGTPLSRFRFRDNVL
jgi:hypothetical protein